MTEPQKITAPLDWSQERITDWCNQNIAEMWKGEWKVQRVEVDSAGSLKIYWMVPANEAVEKGEVVPLKSEKWEMLDTVMNHSRRILVTGPPGTGKTWSAMRTGVAGRKVYSVTLHEDMAASQLKGHFIPKAGEFVWHDGPAVRAWREGARLVLNEIDHAGDDVLTICYALLDDPEFAELSLETGETVRPEAGFQVIATMNGDPDGLPFALRDRFPVCVVIDEPHPDAIKSLPTDLQSMAKTLATGKGPRRTSVRVLKEFEALRTALGEEQAAMACFGDQGKEIVNALKVSRMS